MKRQREEIQEDYEIGSEEDSSRGKYLTFIVCRETYGIDIRYVTEIVSIEAITEMPQMPDYIRGIINLRGRIIPVMDVRLRFGKQERPYDDRTCIIVITYCDELTGLIVDSVSEVLTIPQKSIVELRQINAVDTGGFVNNVGKLGDAVILLLNCDTLIDRELLAEPEPK